MEQNLYVTQLGQQDPTEVCSTVNEETEKDNQSESLPIAKIIAYKEAIAALEMSSISLKGVAYSHFTRMLMPLHH